jgi:PST family polysaccharide transporter
MSASPADSAKSPSGGSSYGQILKSSSILGGTQAITYIIGLIRTKFVAVLLGPSGVGLVGLYLSVIGVVQTFAQLGINQSGVREVAAAAGSKNEEKIAQTVKILRRVCWFTGIFGWILTAALAWPLSLWVFSSSDHVWALAILGSVVLLELVSGGQTALLQGVRRVGDLARLQVTASLVSTLLAVAVYWWLRERGIIPVIVLTSFVQLTASWWFARRVSVSSVEQSWADTWRGSKALLQLGSAFMYGALLTGAVGLAIRALIVRDLGMEAGGIYQAAWALSGMFGAFVLQAMGTDFYPRLTAVASEDSIMCRLVNEQIQTGILLALPGILTAIGLASVLIETFYSAKFYTAAEPLRWFSLGVLGQIVSWPIGMVLVAKGNTVWIYITRTHGAALHLLLTVVLLAIAGLEGVAWAFATYVWLQFIVVFVIAYLLSRLTLSRSTLRLIMIALVFCLVGLAAVESLPRPYGSITVIGGAVIIAIRCVKGLAARVGPNGKLGRLLQKLAFAIR